MNAPSHRTRSKTIPFFDAVSQMLKLAGFDPIKSRYKIKPASNFCRPDSDLTIVVESRHYFQYMCVWDKGFLLCPPRVVGYIDDKEGWENGLQRETTTLGEARCDMLNLSPGTVIACPNERLTITLDQGSHYIAVDAKGAYKCVHKGDAFEYEIAVDPVTEYNLTITISASVNLDTTDPEIIREQAQAELHDALHEYANNHECMGIAPHSYAIDVQVE